MAMFRTAMLFFVMVVAFVKHADGMRSPSQAASRIDEVFVGKKCEEFGAKRDVKWKSLCKCPRHRPKITKECGGSRYSFRPSQASPGCRCVTHAELMEGLARLPVSASALRFCEALVQHGFSHGGFPSTVMEDALKKTSPEICQHALVGTITPKEAKKAPWAQEASELSKEGSGEDANQDGGYGRMQPVKEDAKGPAEKELWEHALAHVCKDECEDLLHMMKEEAGHLLEDVYSKYIPVAQTCAERVVKQVEAEVLGCCARSCGFDGHTCLLWPFFSPKEKVEWDVECCGEMSVLKNSSRERMCNSVLPGRLAKEASKYDREEEDGTDVGKVLIGQNSSLFWTKKGAQQAIRGIKFRLPKKSTKKAGSHRFINKLLHPFGKSVLIKEEEALADSKVTMDFLLKHPNVGEEFLRRGFFREEPLSKMMDESTSIMQMNVHDGTCDFGKFKEQCPTHFVTNYMKTCQDSWNVAEEHEEHGDFEEQVKDLHFGDCSLNKPQYVAAPEDCDKLASKSSDEILVVYFTHEHDREEGPIACVTVGKKQCNGSSKWWEKIQLKSVQDMMNGPEIKDYTDRVYYVKVKADSKQTNQ